MKKRYFHFQYSPSVVLETCDWVPEV